MDPAVNQEWTFSEVEEARSLIARFNINPIIYHENDDNNKKHNDIVDALHAVFPSKTMQQVIKLYVDLVVKMNRMPRREEIHVTGGITHDACTVQDLANINSGELEESVPSSTHGVFTMDDLLNEYNFGLQEEARTVDDPIHVFGYPLEDTRIMEMEELLPMVEKSKMEVLANNVANDKPVVATHQGRYWNEDEHRLFLCGLRVCGRGDWKNISRYFVTTRTTIQVSSHAQKYFKRQEQRKKSGKAGRQRYSINDVQLEADDPLAAENSFSRGHAPSFPGLNYDPSFGSQSPENSAMMNNLAQCWPPITYSQQVSQQQVWSEQQMMGSAAPLMNFAHSYQQGSPYLPLGQF